MNLSQTVSTAMLAAFTAPFNSGTLVFYSGTQPATPETALSGNTVLGTDTFAATAFAAPAASGGYEVATNNTMATGTFTPSSSGTCSFARAFESNGTTVIADFTVGTSGTDIIVGNAAFQTGVSVTLSSISLKTPEV